MIVARISRDSRDPKVMVNCEVDLLKIQKVPRVFIEMNPHGRVRRGGRCDCPAYLLECPLNVRNGLLPFARGHEKQNWLCKPRVDEREVGLDGIELIDAAPVRKTHGLPSLNEAPDLLRAIAVV